MKKNYVPKTLTEFLSESNSIPLKRKYGERPAITAGTNAPLRNQVLSFVAESGAVSKIDLKKFIVGLKEGGSTPASANMFIKRNAKYFMTESRNGVTYFKLSNLGQRLVNQFVPMENGNVSESVKNARKSLSKILESSRRNRRLNEDEEEWDNELDKYEDPSEWYTQLEEYLADEGFSPEKTQRFIDEYYETLEGMRMEHTPEGAADLIISDFQFESKKSRGRKLNEDEEEMEDEEMPEETEEFDVPEDEMDGEMEADDFDGEGSADEVDFERDIDVEDEDMEDEDEVETDEFKYEEDDEKITLTYYKNGSGAETEEDEDFEPEEDEDMDEEDMDEEDMDEEDLEDRPEDEDAREFDFKDKGRPGILGMDESVKAQFVLHNLAGKKKTKLAGRYSTGEYHNLLDDSQEKDEQELKGHIVKSKKNGKLAEANNLGGKLNKSLHNLLTNDQDSDPNEDELDINERDSRVLRMKQIIENLREKRRRMINEAEETEEDELKDDDLDSLDLGDEQEGEETEDTSDELPEETPEEGEIEKVEITEFIITVDDVDAAIDELQELGVTAERVPVEAPAEEVPAPEEETEEEPAEGEEAPAEGEDDIDLDLGGGEEKAEATKESFRKFVAGILNEAEEEKAAEGDDLGSSDELSLGDQGEDATELDTDTEGEDNLEATTEFEENKIKVKAEDWDVLKGWLEEKGVDVKEMFGGDIETEEVDPDSEEAPAEEVSDDDINFDGIGDDDDTKIDDDEEETEKE